MALSNPPDTLQAAAEIGTGLVALATISWQAYKALHKPKPPVDYGDRLGILERSIEIERQRLTAALESLDDRFAHEEAMRNTMHAQSAGRFDRLEHAYEELGKKIDAASDKTVDRIIEVISRANLRGQ